MSSGASTCAICPEQDLLPAGRYRYWSLLPQVHLWPWLQATTCMYLFSWRCTSPLPQGRCEPRRLLLQQHAPCMQATTDADEVDLNLLTTLLEYVSGEGAYQRDDNSGKQQGAVLVFLPGAPAAMTLVHGAWLATGTAGHRAGLPARCTCCCHGQWLAPPAWRASRRANPPRSLISLGHLPPRLAADWPCSQTACCLVPRPCLSTCSANVLDC